MEASCRPYLRSRHTDWLRPALIAKALACGSESTSSAAWDAACRSYGLGINGRGQKTLQELDCWDRIDARFNAPPPPPPSCSPPPLHTDQHLVPCALHCRIPTLSLPPDHHARHQLSKASGVAYHRRELTAPPWTHVTV